MRVRILAALVVVVALAVGVVWLAGRGLLGSDWHAGSPADAPVPDELVAGRARTQRIAANLAGVHQPKQILFGDLHVHSTFSPDAFMSALPLTGGQGAHPVADACDFARHCAGLDFWSINDHAMGLTARRWRETVESVRECNEVAGDSGDPDVVAYLGWEWTQVGTTPEDHYGHKNVILRDLEDGQIPERPIAASLPAGTTPDAAPGTWALGLGALLTARQGGLDMARYLDEMFRVPDCGEGADEGECIERAPTPVELFEKLDARGHETLVIPHGTTWGFYTPPGSSWDKQLAPGMHDPERQRLVEVYSGHGNSEEYRPWRSVSRGADGAESCPDPTGGYVPSCWRAGEIIRERCLEAEESPETCDERASAARQDFVAAGLAGHLTVPGERPSDWGASGQCTDCFQPAFNYRPASSVQYIMALSRSDGTEDPLRFRFGFMASSDNHSARPGTGYKELWKREMTDFRLGGVAKSVLAGGGESDEEPVAESRPVDATSIPLYSVAEVERQASFFMTGGLVAVHSAGRDRGSIWEAMQRREVYGTSGPHILLWFDLVDPSTGERLPMGSQVRRSDAPIFQVRALGSFEQEPGCPEESVTALGEERIETMCGGECYHPSSERRQIARVEVVRIRPQATPGEAVGPLIEDPWKVLRCVPDAAGCRVTFRDPEYPKVQRDAVYYVRAIEEPSQAVDYDGVACFGKDADDDCLGAAEQRAWSSPIFVDWGG